MSLFQKVQVYAILSEYIIQNIDKPQSSKVGILEKNRISKADEALKTKLMEAYNQKLDAFSTSYTKEFDFSIVGDLLLDLFRHKQTSIVDMKNAQSDFIKVSKSGGVYKLSQFIARIQGQQM